ncbi:MAG: J domain-containing protein [Hyphomicrobiaceae bacterium]|nr:J domain-containing protein [Hyphomicrobiaceae bacterium]
MRDPYTVLGVAKSASAADVKSAYRKLAKAYHPDQNKNDPNAQSKFAEVTAAYDLLSDKTKRGQYDRGEIDADGNPKFGGFDFAGARTRGAGPGATGGINPEDILKEFMGGLGGGFGGAQARTNRTGGAGWDPFSGGPQRQAPTKGKDFTAPISVTLEQAHRAETVPLTLSNGKVLSVKLPIGVQDGQQIRLKDQGQPSPAGGEPGDAILTVKFARHKYFRRDGKDLRVEVPITLYEAVLGARVRVPTLDGPVEISVPIGADTSKAMRLKGKGLQGEGDLLVGLRIVLPKGGDPDLESLMRFWRDQKPYDVRD